MKREIGTGIQDFQKLRMNDRFYVDKTDFIREWWNGGDDVTLITRPRRFGKTLNMSMLNCFFSNKYASRGDLFEGLKVWDDPAMREQQGQWPVLFLTFAGIKQTTFDETRRSINLMLANLYNQYDWMLKEPVFTDADRSLFQSVTRDMENDLAAVSIRQLCEWLSRYYGKNVLIFLDEYDTPLQEAYLNGYWDELVAYTRALFNSTFKTNPCLERAIMTGITRVSKESIFSDLNNLTVITTSSPLYATSFGFTESEVFDALDQQGFTNQDKANVKTWYDGFTFGDVKDIYNPWSVTNYLNFRTLDTYWANSSGNGLVGRLISRGDPEVKILFEDLMNGGAVKVPLDEQIIFKQLDTNSDAIWSLLLATGYVKIVEAMSEEESVREDKDRIYTLTLTNLEVRHMFRKMFQNWFAQTKALSRFAKAIFQGDEESMEVYLNDIMHTSMSFFDGGASSTIRLAENFYHGLVLGLLADNTKDYEVTSNRESGLGRYDVMLIPKSPDLPAAILEFKLFNPRRGEKDLEDTAANALKQIEDKHYEAALLSRGVPKEHILKYGFAFRDKECLIRMGE